MTVTSETVRTAYAGNGSTTVFSTGFKFYDNDHVVAFLVTDATGVKVDWVEGSNYTLTGAGGVGSLTASVAPASGTTLVITLDVPNTQEEDLPTGGAFPSSTVETALDLAAQRTARVAFDIGRALHAPVTDDGSIDMELPNEVARANRYLYFDSDGEPTAVESVSLGSVSVSAFAETLLDDANAATARSTLGLGTAATQATGTSGANVPLLNGNNTHSGTTTHTGTVTNQATVDNQQQFRLSGDVNAPQITAQQDNYAPSGFTTGSVIMLDANAAGLDITGLAGGADGRIAILYNEGSNRIDLIDESASSTAANRFAINEDIGIDPNTGVGLIYDSVNSRWRCFARGLSYATAADMVAATSQSAFVTPLFQHRHPGHPKFFVKADAAGNSLASYNLTSVTDDGTGQLTATIATDFSSANWKCDAQCEQISTTLTAAGGNVERAFIRFGGQAAGSVIINASDFTATTHVLRDPTAYHVGGSGAQ